MVHFVCEFKRKMEGFPWWKTIIFHLLMRANRFASTRLRLPTIIRYDSEGAFWTEYLGAFTDLTLAHNAIARMRAEREAQGQHSQFELTEDLPLNGLLPGQTDRYVNQDFPGSDLREFYKVNTGPVMCPFKRTLCTPEDVMSRKEAEPLFDALAGIETAIKQ